MYEGSAGNIAQQGLFFGKQGTATSPQKTRHVVVMADVGRHDGVPRALVLLANRLTVHKKYFLSDLCAVKNNAKRR
jgi:hypothetical protein